MKTRNQRILLVLVLIAIVAVGGYYVFANTTAPDQGQLKNATSTSVTLKAQDNNVEGKAATQNPAIATDSETEWIRYADEKGFSFEIPSNWKREDTYRFSYSSSNSIQVMRASVDVLPITNLRADEDPSAEIMYEAVKKEWISISCTDFSMTTGCNEAKNVTRKVIASNVVVGGVQAYVIRDQSPAEYIVPINSKYGLVITLSSSSERINELNPTLQQILASFKFNEPRS